MSDAKQVWFVGQECVQDRQRVVTIERVTPSGRLVVEGRTFENSGRERGAANPYRPQVIEPLTEDLRAEMNLVSRGRKAREDVFKALTSAEQWLRQSIPVHGHASVPGEEDVLRAERLASAISDALA